MEKLMIDSDVIVNWLVQEEEKHTQRKLWIAPTTILELGEMGKQINGLSFLSILEIRFVLRRKKLLNPTHIERDLIKICDILHVYSPTSDELNDANQLQSEQLLDPFDSILLAQAISISAPLISRDRGFLQIARHYTSCYTPEEYLAQYLN